MQVENNQLEMKPSKVKGCLATIIVFGLMFGIPFIIMRTGITLDSFIAQLFFLLVFIGVNVGLFKYRKSQKFEARKFYDLKIRSTSTNSDSVNVPPKDISQNDLSNVDEVENSKEILKEVENIQDKEVKNSFCTECGAKLQETTKFCTSCGKKL